MAKAKKTKNNGKKLTFKETMKIIWWTIKFNAKISLAATIIMTITDVLRALRSIAEVAYYAIVIDKLVDVAANGEDITQMFNYLLGYLALLLVFSVNNRIRNLSMQYMNTYSNRSIKRALYLKIFELGTQSIENPKTRKLLQTTEQEVFEIRWFMNQIVMGFSELIKVFISSSIVYTISPTIFFSILGIVIPMIWVQFYYNKKDWGNYKKYQDELRLTNRISNFLRNPQFLHENTINNVKNIFDKKYWTGQMKFVKENINIQRQWNITEFFVGTIGTLVILGGYYFLFDQYIAGLLSIGTMGFYTGTLWNFFGSMEYFGFFVSSVQQRAIRFKEVVKFFELDTETKEGDIELDDFVTPPQIEIRKLSFKYPRTKKKVLDNISITIKPGEKVAIVGHNGAGKTTLIKQISRTYNLKPKSIFIDGLDLSKTTLRSWYKNIGVLFQDYNFYNVLSAEENISIGRPNIKKDKDRVIKASKMADADEFIMEYKKGYNTLMDESFKGGIRPSIGQQQKIAIARFFYRDAPIVIFDEPTAAIDAVAEYKIFNKIYEFFKGKTVIIISHRFSTVRNADMIYVMDKGKITEKGNHEQLLEIDGTYANAFKLQAEGYQVADKNKDGVVDEKEKLEAAQIKES
jgi:ATP-binding cassette, subfamily B, bacterial